MEYVLPNGLRLTNIPEDFSEEKILSIAKESGLYQPDSSAFIQPQFLNGQNPSLRNELPDPTVFENIQGLGASALIAGQRALKAIPDFASWVVPGEDPLEKYVSGPISETLEKGIEYTEGLKPEAYKARQTAPILERDEQGNIEGVNMPTWQLVAGNVVESLGYIPEIIWGAGKIKGGIEKIKWLRDFAKQHPKLTDAITYGSINTAIVAPGQWRDTYNEALELGLEKDEARKAADTASFLTAGVSAMTGGAGGALASTLASRSKLLSSAMAKGFMADAPFEGIEEASQSAIGEYALGKDIDPANALEAGLVGALAGGAPGAAIGAGIHLGRKTKPDYIGESIKPPSLPEMEPISKAKQAANSAYLYANANLQATRNKTRDSISPDEVVGRNNVLMQMVERDLRQRLEGELNEEQKALGKILRKGEAQTEGLYSEENKFKWLKEELGKRNTKAAGATTRMEVSDQDTQNFIESFNELTDAVNTHNSILSDKERWAFYEETLQPLEDKYRTLRKDFNVDREFTKDIEDVMTNKRIAPTRENLEISSKLAKQHLKKNSEANRLLKESGVSVNAFHNALTAVSNAQQKIPYHNRILDPVTKKEMNEGELRDQVTQERKKDFEKIDQKYRQLPNDPEILDEKNREINRIENQIEAAVFRRRGATEQEIKSIQKLNEFKNKSRRNRMFLDSMVNTIKGVAEHGNFISNLSFEREFDPAFEKFLPYLQKMSEQRGLEDISRSLVRSMTRVAKDDQGNVIYKVKKGTPESEDEIKFDINGEFVFDLAENKTAAGQYVGAAKHILLSTDRAKEAALIAQAQRLSKSAEYGGDPQGLYALLKAGRIDEEITDADIQTALKETLDHETIHALKHLDLFTKEEWQTLVNQAKKTPFSYEGLLDPEGVKSKLENQAKEPVTYYQYAKQAYAGYEGFEEVDFEEEAVAEMFKHAIRNKEEVNGLVQRIVELFRRLANALKGEGFNTYEDLIAKIDTGKIGSRPRIDRHGQAIINTISSTTARGVNKRIDAIRDQLTPDNMEKVAQEIAKEIYPEYIGDLKISEAISLSAITNSLRNKGQQLQRSYGTVRTPSGNQGRVGGFYDLGAPSNHAAESIYDAGFGSLLGQLRQHFQDKYIGLKNIEEAISVLMGRKLTEGESAYYGEMLSHGKIGQLGLEFERTQVKDLIDKLIDSKLEFADVDEFLVYRHAIERNIRIKKINPNHQGPGAGMLDGRQLTNDHVKDVMKDRYGATWNDAEEKWIFNSTGSREAKARGQLLQDIADGYIQPIIEGTLDIAEEYELINEHDRKLLSSDRNNGGYYRYYAPLRGFAGEAEQEYAEGLLQETGSGGSISIRGPQSKRALGRTTESFSPLSHIVQDRTRTIVRGVKNKDITQRLFKLVEGNPNIKLWEIFDPQAPENINDPDLREMIMRQDSFYTYVGKPGDPGYDANEAAVGRTRSLQGRRDLRNWVKQVRKSPSLRMAIGDRTLITVKMDGQDKFIDIKEDKLRNAFLNSGVQSKNILIRILGKINRYLSFVNTSANPHFLYSNVFRDVQTAMGSLVTEKHAEDGALYDLQGKVSDSELAWKIVKGWKGSASGMLKHFRNKGTDPDVEQFLKAGGKADWFHSVPPAQQKVHLTRMYEMAKGSAKGRAMRGAKTVHDFVENINAAAENAVRLSAFKTIRDTLIDKANLSQEEAIQRAARVAKELTINFNRKGAAGEFWNSLYLFFNAQMQGTAVVLRGITSSKVKRQILGSAIGFGALMAALHDALADEEEKELHNVQDFVRERNMIIPGAIFGLDYDIKIPLPYGYNVFYNLGSNLEMVATGKMDISQALSELAGSFLGSFSPLGAPGGEDILSTVMPMAVPTAAKPFVEVWSNQNYFGSPVWKRDNEFGVPIPDAHRAFRNTSVVWKNLAEGFNAITGGNESRPGWGDVSPDTLSHLFSAATGGAGTFAGKALVKPFGNISEGKQLFEQMNDVPFLRTMLHEYTNAPDTEAYFDRKDRVNQEYRQFTENLKRKPEERREYLEKYGDYIKMKPFFDNVEKRLRKLRKVRREIEKMIEVNPDNAHMYYERSQNIEEKIDEIINKANEIYEQRMED